MKPTSKTFKSLCSLLILMLHTVYVDAGSRFASHVTVNTPARSFSHGVGDPLPFSGRRNFQRQQGRHPQKSLRRRPISRNQGGGGGYPKVKPTIAFNNEDKPHDIFQSITPRHQNSFMEVSIPMLPPSPYKVDSPDPESLWPEGLFLPPIGPRRFGNFNRRSDTGGGVSTDSDILDPYLLEGSEAIAAVKRSRNHGHLFFHEIPHIQSLLANQELRIQNQLEPHRLGSIRHTWAYYRP